MYCYFCKWTRIDTNYVIDIFGLKMGKTLEFVLLNIDQIFDNFRHCSSVSIVAFEQVNVGSLYT